MINYTQRENKAQMQQYVSAQMRITIDRPNLAGAVSPSDQERTVLHMSREENIRKIIRILEYYGILPLPDQQADDPEHQPEPESAHPTSS